MKRKMKLEAYAALRAKGLNLKMKEGFMETLQPFSATKKQYELSEEEYRELKNELISLRREFVLKSGMHQRVVNTGELGDIEQKMYSIEHKLAHSDVTREEVRAPDMFDMISAVYTEIRMLLNGLWMKITMKVTHKPHQTKHVENH